MKSVVIGAGEQQISAGRTRENTVYIVLWMRWVREGRKG